MSTGISWTDETWNPIVGCSIQSPGCRFCYAMREASSVDRKQQDQHYSVEKRKYAGLYQFVKNDIPVWTGELRLWESALEIPLRRRKPTRWFVNSMGDLGHEKVRPEWFAEVWSVMSEAVFQRGHVFQILTKQPANLLRLMTAIGVRDTHPGIWIGVSAEDTVRWDQRVPVLLSIPASVRFISVEPQLEAIDRDPYGIEWVLQGGENADEARRFDVEWARDMRDRCAATGSAYFLKQLGCAAFEDGRPYRTRAHKGDKPSEWPADLQVQEWPSRCRVSKRYFLPFGRFIKYPDSNVVTVDAIDDHPTIVAP